MTKMTKLWGALALIFAAGMTWGALDETGAQPTLWLTFDKQTALWTHSGSDTSVSFGDSGASYFKALGDSGDKGNGAYPASSHWPYMENKNVLNCSQFTIVESLKVNPENYHTSNGGTAGRPMVLFSIGHGWWSGDTRGVGVAIDATHIYLKKWGASVTFADESACTVAHGIADLANAGFHSYAMSYDSTGHTIKVFVDGVEKISAVMTETWSTSNSSRKCWGPFFASCGGGDESNWSVNRAKAANDDKSNAVSDVRIYQSCLTAEKLAKIAALKYVSDDTGAITTLSAGSLTYAAGTEGTLTVNAGATLTLTVTEDQKRLGYTSSVTLNQGATLTFVDTIGNELQASSEDPRVLPPATTISIVVDEDKAASAIAELADLTVDSIVTITINAEKTLTVDKSFPGTIIVEGDGLFKVPSGTSVTLSEAAISANVLVEGTLMTTAEVSMTGTTKFDSNSSVTVASGSMTITETCSGVSGQGNTRGLMGTITIEKDATLALNCGDAINYSGTTVLNVKGTLDCGNFRQSFKAGNTFNLYEGGRITGTGDSYAALDFTNGGNGDTIHVLASDSDSSNLATIDAVIRSNAAAGKITFDIADGLTVALNGTYKQGAIQIPTGTVKTSVEANLNGKTFTVGENGTLEFSPTSNATLESLDLSHITGQGTIKFSGNNWVSIPTDASNKLFASTLSVVNNLTNGILMKEGDNTYTIGSLSGNGSFRYDWGSNLRTLIIKQSKNTSWTGNIVNSSGHSGTRALNISVQSENNSVLTVSTLSSGTATLTAGEGGTINITESCAGIGVVLDGGKITSPGVDNAHGTMVKSLTLNKDGSYVWSGTGDGFIGIGANGQDSKLDLGGHELTLTGKDTGTRVYLDKVTSFPNGGTINVTKGKLFFHCSVPTFPAGTKLVIGANATAEVASEITPKTVTTPELVYDGTVNPNSGEAAAFVVTDKFSGSTTVPNLTLADNCTIEVATKPEDGAVIAQATSLTVAKPETIKVSVAGVVDETISVEMDGNTLKTKIAQKIVAELYDEKFATFQEAIDKAYEYAGYYGEPGSADFEETFRQILAGIMILDTEATVPAGYQLVNSVVPGEDTPRWHLEEKVIPSAAFNVTINGVTTGYATLDEALEAVAGADTKPTLTLGAGQETPNGFVKAEDGTLTACDYIVISPSTFVSNWETYIAARKASTVGAALNYAVKNASEIYTSFPVVTESPLTGKPRNDAESIHKWIGIMQKLGTKYFVLGGNWKGIDYEWGRYQESDRDTCIPGIIAHPTKKASAGSILDMRPSDLYYACHFKPEGQKYFWDPSEDGVYIGLNEQNPDTGIDKRQLTPSCVVTRMEFDVGNNGMNADLYKQRIDSYTKKLAKGEAPNFAGNDRYVAWTAQCQTFIDGIPDVYGVMKERLESINKTRGAKELLHLVYLGKEKTYETMYDEETMPAELLAENKASVTAGNWELFLPFGHGIPGSFAGLESTDFESMTGLTKFFMCNIPCLTGSVIASQPTPATVLSQANGGALVAINNTSYGYLTPTGITQRYRGLSDELADYCLDSYVKGSDAGTAWRTAISTYTGKLFTDTGVNESAATYRDLYTSAEKIPEGKTPEQVKKEDESYIYAGIIEQMLFGDPLVKIQGNMSANRIAVEAKRSARDHYYVASDFASAMTELNKEDGKFVKVTGTCATDNAITVNEGKTLIVENTSFTAPSVTVNGTLQGAGTVNANISFAENGVLDVSQLSKLTVGDGKSVTAARGLNLVLPASVRVIPAVNTLVVAEQSNGTAFENLTIQSVKSVAGATFTPATSKGIFSLVKENGKVYLKDTSNVIVLEHLLSGLNAKIDVVFVDGFAVSQIEGGYYEVPVGSKVVITIGPDAEHRGDKVTATINAAENKDAILVALQGVLQTTVGSNKYTEEREASTVYYNAGSSLYTGSMANLVVNLDEQPSTILENDTVIFNDKHDVPSTIKVAADAVGTQLVIDKDVTFTSESTDAIFTGKTITINNEHTVTFTPSNEGGLAVGNCTMDKGTAVFEANGDKNIFFLDSIVGTTVLDLRKGVVIKPLDSTGWIHFHTRVTGGATVDSNVRILGNSRVVVKGEDYLTVTGAVTAQVIGPDGEPVEDKYHRLTIDATAAKVTNSDGSIKLQTTILKFASQEIAEQIIPRINLVAPEVYKHNGEKVVWQLIAGENGEVLMRELVYSPTSTFFTTGILGEGEKAEWLPESGFTENVTKISATCPAELVFNFAGADESASITVTKPIELSGSGYLTFDIPEGHTVYVESKIIGTAGVRKFGKGTLVFSLPAGATDSEQYDNLFEGALVVTEGMVQTTKLHGYSRHRDLPDGTVETPEIAIHSGAILDLAYVCTQDKIDIISAGTITNSYHDVTGTKVGQIKSLTLDGDTTISGHTFGMAHESKIDLKGHKLTISMERGECVTVGSEIRDHEFEFDNTTVTGGKDNLDDPDIVIVQGTLSCEGSTCNADGSNFVMGNNHLGDAALYVGADACLRLDANLIVKRIQIVNGNNDVVVKCHVNPDGTPASEHEHTLTKIWEQSANPKADADRDDDNKFFGKIIIRQELRGGIKAPRIQLGVQGEDADIYAMIGDMWSPIIRRIVLDKGEYFDCTQEMIMSGAPFDVFFIDWTGESGARRLFHGWEKFSADRSGAEIMTCYGVKFRGDGSVSTTMCDWYPYGAWAFRDCPLQDENVPSMPLADNNWAYVVPVWPNFDANIEYTYSIITAITHLDGKSIYDDSNNLIPYNPALGEGSGNLITTNNLLAVKNPRGDRLMDFIISEEWLRTYMKDEQGMSLYDQYMVSGRSDGTISAWLNTNGANGIERWQSYMLGLDPTRADSLPVLAIRDAIPPSVQKGGKTFVNVKVGGIAPRGYQYISPVYQIEELDPATMKVIPSTVTPWQTSVNFQVEVPTKTDVQGRSTPAVDYLKYFRVNVSFQGSDGMN